MRATRTRIILFTLAFVAQTHALAENIQFATQSAPLQVLRTPTVTVVIGCVRVGGTNRIVVTRSDGENAPWSAHRIISDASQSAAAPAKLTTDGNGHWIAVWPSRPSRPAGTDARTRLAYAESEDNGVSWTRPAIISANGPDGAIVAVKPVPGHDRWCVAVQSDAIESDNIPTVYLMYSDVGAGNWSTPEVLYRDQHTPATNVSSATNFPTSPDDSLRIAWSWALEDQCEVQLYTADWSAQRATWTINRHILRYSPPSNTQAKDRDSSDTTSYAVSGIIAFYLAAAYISRSRWQSVVQTVARSSELTSS